MIPPTAPVPGTAIHCVRRPLERGTGGAFTVWRTTTCTIALTLFACTDPQAAEHSARLLTIRGGDRQVGFVQQRLERALVIGSVQSDGEPPIPTTIRWSTRDGGTFSPEESTTDEQGHARTTWTLGTWPGKQYARATASDGSFVEIEAMAISAVDAKPEPPRVLALSTPDGSGQTVHPDYVTMPGGWRHDREYLLVTPYPNGDQRYENPSVFRHDYASANVWRPPVGVTNPIARPTQIHLSDPDVVAVPESRELWIYYRSVGTANEIFMMRSPDGVQFSTPTLVVSAPNHEIVSPTVVRRGPNDWLMWSVNANVGCAGASTLVELRRSTDGLQWSSPEPVSLSQGGFFPWHIDVQWIPSRGEFWAIYNGKTAGTCTTPALFLATSPDGLHWTTYPSPILARGVIPEFTDVVYRSTFAYDPSTDTVDFWYSGAEYVAPNYIWRSAQQTRSRRELFWTANRKAATFAGALAPQRHVPPLLDAP